MRIIKEESRNSQLFPDSFADFHWQVQLTQQAMIGRQGEGTAEEQQVSNLGTEQPAHRSLSVSDR
ncbi:MAG: hypothetical protein P8N76_19450 [Pirellulaceae bacterium]|nr:hypothetical protein [Pirellulaceae bacterium]